MLGHFDSLDTGARGILRGRPFRTAAAGARLLEALKVEDIGMVSDGIARVGRHDGLSSGDESPIPQFDLQKGKEQEEAGEGNQKRSSWVAEP
jgi:hypothetical protein